MSLLHSQSGLALVLSLLLLMVINYYYPATQSTADVMSPTSLGQRGKKKKKAGCPGRGRLLAGSERGFATTSGALGFWQEPWQVSASQPPQLAFRLVCLEVLPAAAHVSGQGVFCGFFWGVENTK